MVPELESDFCMQISKVPTNEIFADPEFNCRGMIIPFDVTNLMQSIRQEGLHQPIVIQGYDKKPGFKYRIVMGHRRFKAMQLLEWKEVPAIVRNDFDEAHARASNLVENLQRKDLTLMQEAKALQKMLRIGLKHRDLAEMVGKSTGWVQVRLMVLGLPSEIQDYVSSGLINADQVKDLTALGNEQIQFEVARTIVDRKLRGEKSSVNLKAMLKKQKKDPNYMHKKEPREIKDIFAMQDVIRENLGNGIGTRLLAWTAGEISTHEMFEDLEKMCIEAGRPFLKSIF